MLHTHGEGRDRDRDPGSLASPKHPNPSKRYEEHPSSSLAPDPHVGSVWESTQGLVQNNANSFSSHQTELNPCIWGYPDPRGDAANISCALQSSASHRDSQGPEEITRRSSSSLIRRHRAQPGQQPMGSTAPQQVRLQTSPVSGTTPHLSLFLLHWWCPPSPPIPPSQWHYPPAPLLALHHHPLTRPGRGRWADKSRDGVGG